MIGRTNSGSGGGLLPNVAILHVDATYGSTVSITDGTVTKTQDYTKSHINNDDPNRADYYFTIPSSGYGTWTVTVTLDESVVTDTVSITTNRQYDLQSVYWLFRDGDQCTVITGGWSGSEYYDSNGDSNAINPGNTNNNRLNCTGVSGTKGKFGLIGTANKIDLSKFSKIVYVCTKTSAHTNGTCIQGTRAIASRDMQTGTSAYVLASNGSGSVTLSADISNTTGSYYVVFSVGKAGSCSAYCTQVYMI